MVIPEIKDEKDPILTKNEQEAISILALEGIYVNAYNIYLDRLYEAGKITISEAGYAAVEFDKTGFKKY